MRGAHAPRAPLLNLCEYTWTWKSSKIARCVLILGNDPHAEAIAVAENVDNDCFAQRRHGVARAQNLALKSKPRSILRSGHPLADRCCFAVTRKRKDAIATYVDSNRMAFRLAMESRPGHFAYGICSILCSNAFGYVIAQQRGRQGVAQAQKSRAPWNRARSCAQATPLPTPLLHNHAAAKLAFAFSYVNIVKRLKVLFFEKWRSCGCGRFQGRDCIAQRRHGVTRAQNLALRNKPRSNLHSGHSLADR